MSLSHSKTTVRGQRPSLSCKALGRGVSALACGLALLVSAGCAKNEESPANDVPNPKTGTSATDTTNGTDSGPDKVEPKVEDKKPDYAAIWAKMFEKAELQLEDGDMAAVQATIEELNEVYIDPEKPSEEQLASLTSLKEKLADKLKALASESREQNLANARKLMDIGKFDEAVAALDDVVARSPTTEQRRTAGRLKAEIERRRGAQRRLMTWMKLLGSSDRGEVRAAQNQLSKEPETALPLLLKSVQDTENKELVSNTLEMMRRLKRPDITLPAMVGVLKRVEQKANWQDAIDEIVRTAQPGTGDALLEIVSNSEMADQRSVALSGLSQIVDPPQQTLVTLLPLIYSDTPELPSALQAANNAMQVHRQFDLIALRGIDAELTPEQAQQLATLADRLAEIVKAGAAADPPSEAAYAANVLSIAARQSAPQPIAGVKVTSTIAESEAGPAAAVLDGVWNSVEPKTMWRHTINRPGTIVLDMGVEKTVVGVRIWNFNEPGGMHRGWKETNVFVSDSPTALTPIATGIVPPAPGAADTPDYSTTIPVNFARGRYVILKAKNVWRPDSHMGLSEVQILGF